MDTSPEPGSHERAVLQQDNGELQEDAVEDADEDAVEDADEDVDEASRESFPASDPPASWAGGAEDSGGDPVPGTLPRD